MKTIIQKLMLYVAMLKVRKYFFVQIVNPVAVKITVYATEDMNGMQGNIGDFKGEIE